MQNIKISHPIFETHCHLDYPNDFSTQELVDKSVEVGISKITTIAVSKDHLNNLIKISKDLTSKACQVYCTQGIHPHEASLVDEKTYETIRENTLNNPKQVIAIGEIGLDYHYNKSPRSTQIKVFENFLKMADELQKPVVIHTREAEEDTINILKNAKSSKIKNIVLHSFTSNQKLADFAIDNNFFIGINGISSFKNSSSLREVLKQVPLKLIVLETDSPFLAPVPFRGKKNAPFYLPHIAKSVAEFRNINIDILLKASWENSHKLFDL